MAAVDSATQTVEYSLEAIHGIRELLATVPCTSDILRDTPIRVARAFQEMTAGYAVDVAELLRARFPSTCEDLVILKDIEFTSLCEHHLMPFYGRAHIGYLPQGAVLGVSKLARLVDAYALRLQIQERLCAEIAQALVEFVSPEGAGVIIEASHACMSCRGVKRSRASFITSSMLGQFRTDAALRHEFLTAVGMTHSAI